MNSVMVASFELQNWPMLACARVARGESARSFEMFARDDSSAEVGAGMPIEPVLDPKAHGSVNFQVGQRSTRDP